MGAYRKVNGHPALEGKEPHLESHKLSTERCGCLPHCQAMGQASRRDHARGEGATCHARVSSTSASVQTRVGVAEHEGSARGPLHVDTAQKSDKYLP